MDAMISKELFLLTTKDHFDLLSSSRIANPKVLASSTETQNLNHEKT